MNHRLIILSIPILLVGCMHITPFAEDQVPISRWRLNCNEPFVFTKNCFDVKEEQLYIQINKIKIFLSASEDEKTVIFIANHQKIDPYGLLDIMSKDSAKILNHVQDRLSTNHGITMTRATPVTFMRDVVGYVMEFDKPAYNYVVALGSPSKNKISRPEGLGY